jgi:hypothetical protein
VEVDFIELPDRFINKAHIVEVYEIRPIWRISLTNNQHVDVEGERAQTVLNAICPPKPTPKRTRKSTKQEN